MLNHQIIKKSHTLVFSRNGSPCGSLDDPDLVAVFVRSMSEIATFEPNSREAVKFCTMLDEAFDRGRFDKADEIKKVLGIEIRR